MERNTQTPETLVDFSETAPSRLAHHQRWCHGWACRRVTLSEPNQDTGPVHGEPVPREQRWFRFGAGRTRSPRPLGFRGPRGKGCGATVGPISCGYARTSDFDGIALPSCPRNQRQPMDSRCVFPFQDFIPVFRGRVVRDARSLDHFQYLPTGGSWWADKQPGTPSLSRLTLSGLGRITSMSHGPSPGLQDAWLLGQRRKLRSSRVLGSVHSAGFVPSSPVDRCVPFATKPASQLPHQEQSYPRHDRPYPPR